MKKMIFVGILFATFLSNSALSNDNKSVFEVYQASLNTPQYQSMIDQGNKRILALDAQYKQILQDTNMPLAPAPPLTALEIIGVLSYSSGWTYVSNVNDLVHPYNVADIIAIHTIEYGYGQNRIAKFNGSNLVKYDETAILDSGNVVIGWHYGYSITDWNFMADSGSATYQATSINSPWNTETDSLYIP
ncbi:DUF4879 domain-containing protein [uncultured Shewanella sp.]|uniref:DUF4879 domain-containing protein n=1 Tax=uncultured Shewanella sp. TaxID=173975 RepID=UPI00261E1C4E|nr:DUF4879 domain-containing protein [uncultured Shewanella sp.]